MISSDEEENDNFSFISIDETHSVVLTGKRETRGAVFFCVFHSPLRYHLKFQTDLKTLCFLL